MEPVVIRVRRGLGRMVRYQIGTVHRYLRHGALSADLQESADLGPRIRATCRVTAGQWQVVTPYEWDCYTPDDLLRVVIHAPSEMRADRPPGYALGVTGAAHVVARYGFPTLAAAQAAAAPLVAQVVATDLNGLTLTDWQVVGGNGGTYLQYAYGHGLLVLAVPQVAPWVARGVGGGWFMELPPQPTQRAAQQAALILADHATQTQIAALPAWQPTWWVTRYRVPARP